MRRFALLGLVLMLPGCSGFLHFINDTSGLTVNQNAPIGDSENMSRARGHDVSIDPLLTEPGDVWPGPPKPEPTLSDLQRMQQEQAPDQAPPRGAPAAPAFNLPPALLAPQGPAIGVPDKNAPTTNFQTPSGTLHGKPAPGGGFDVLTTPKGQNGGIAIPNGNGTSTIIAPDGTVTTVPTPGSATSGAAAPAPTTPPAAATPPAKKP